CLMSTASPIGGRTTTWTSYASHACSCGRSVRRSLGACSQSINSQSMPLPAQISATSGLPEATHIPIWGVPLRRAAANALCSGACIGAPPDEAACDGAERAEVGVEGISVVGVHGPGEGAGQDDQAGLQGHPIGGELVGQP